MLKKTIFLLAILTVACVVLASSIKRSGILSVKPTESGKADEITSAPGMVLARVVIPFDQLTAQAEAAVPETYNDHGNGPDLCERILGQKVCVGTKYDYTVSRGPISIRQAGDDSIRVSVLLNVKGKGGFRGGGAKLLDLDAKNFRAKVEAFAVIGLSLGSDWCPSTKVDTGFRWIEGARVEIVGGVWIGIKDLVEDALRGQLRTMGHQIASAIRCEDIRREAEKLWASHSLPIQVPGAAPLYMNLKPRSLGFSGIQTTAEAALFLIALELDAEVASEPASSTPMPLPELQALSAEADSLNLALPIRVAYDHLEEALSAQVVGEAFPAETPAGTATTTVHEIEVYPSEERLVVGARVTIDLPNRWLDVKGWVYLIATPIAISEGRGIRLKNPAFSRALDNQLWNLISAALDQTIREQLERVGTINLKEPIQLAEDALAEALTTPLDGAELDVGEPSIRLGRIFPGRSDLTVELLFRSNATLTYRGQI